MTLLNPARGAKHAPEKPSLFVRFCSPAAVKIATLQADFLHLSVQSCKVSCKAFAAEMGRTTKRDFLSIRCRAARRHGALKLRDAMSS
jgi:hypothetical protein